MVSVLPDNGETEVEPSGAADEGSEPGATTATEEAPPLDEIFDVLRNSRRRHVLQRLATIEQPTSLSELSEYIGGIENDKPPEALTSQERKRVYVGLYQSHLPKMADAGAISYDDRGTVEPGPHFDLFREYMENPDADPVPTPGYTVGVVAACLLGVGVVLFAGETLSAVLIAILIGLTGLAGVRFSE